jgi:hypothetical protein
LAYLELYIAASLFFFSTPTDNNVTVSKVS